MADTKASLETAATALTGAEIVRIVQGAASKRTTAAGILAPIFTAMAASAIDFALAGNSKSLTGNITATYSNSGAPVEGDSTLVEFTADSTARVVTFATTTYSLTRQGNVGSVTVPASGTLKMRISYRGARYEIEGDPPAVTGSGSYVLADAPTINLDVTLPTDDTFAGITVSGKLAGATIAQWETVYMAVGGKWLLADANGSGTYPAAGVAIAAYVDTNPAVILHRGVVRNDAWNWTIGGRIYLSTTSGGLTQTAPSTSGDKVQDVGYAITADIAYLDFNGTYLEVT